MWIKRVQIAGWRSFSHDDPLELDDCGAVNLLMGPNNVGKSNIQRFFCRLAERTDPIIFGQHRFDWSGPHPVELALEDTDLHWTNSRRELHAVIEYSQVHEPDPPMLEGITADGRFILEIDGSLGTSRRSDILNPLYPRTRTPLFGGPGLSEIHSENAEHIDHDTARPNWHETRNGLDALFLSALQNSIRVIEAQRDPRANSNANSPVRLVPGTIAPQLRWIKDNRPGAWAGIQADLQRWLAGVLGYRHPDLDFRTPERGGLITTLRRLSFEGGHFPPTPIEDHGAGVSEYLTLLAFLRLRTSDEPIAVFVDELEAHLHPTAARDIVTIIRDNFPKVQLFLATHSTHLLDHLDENWRVFRLAMPELATRVTRSSASRSVIDSIWEMGYRPAQMYLTNSVIWVEGPSDVIYIRALIEHIAPDLSEGRDYAFSFYGGSNIRHVSYDDDGEALVSLLRVCHKPIVVCDRDRADDSPLKPAVRRMKAAAQEFGLAFFESPGYEIESIMSSASLAAIVDKLLSKMRRVRRGKIDVEKLDLQHSLRDALAEAIEPDDQSASAAEIATHIAGSSKVEIALAFEVDVRAGKASFSSDGHEWGARLVDAIRSASA